jgi:hypothetical protein
MRFWRILLPQLPTNQLSYRYTSSATDIPAQLPTNQLSYHSIPVWWKWRPGESSPYSDLLQAERSEDRNPVVPRFSVPIQTGPEVQPASHTMRTGLFSVVKRPGRGAEKNLFPSPCSEGIGVVPPPPLLCACISMSLVDLYIWWR